MNRLHLFINLIVICFIGFPLKGDTQSLTLMDSVKHHASELIRSKDSMVREEAYLFLNENLGDLLADYDSFNDSFPEIEGLSVLENQDLEIRMISYQLYRDTSSYVYGGWLQTKKHTSPLFLTDLSEQMKDDPDLDFMTLSTGQWYGALYYQWHPFIISEDEWVLLLFGMDNYHFFTKRKILETLVIKDGNISFGKAVIETEPNLPAVYLKKRFLLDFSVQAPATLRYDADRDMVIFDHLTFMKSDIPQQKVMRVPDGTYAGFKLDSVSNKLTYMEKVFDQVMDEAPGGRPKSAVKRDLFGNPLKN